MKILSLSLGLFLLATGARAAEPASSTVTLRDFKLTGDLHGGHADFTLTATAHVEQAHASLDLISGNVALTEFDTHPKWNIDAEQSRYVATFDRAGDFPLKLRFSAAVRQSDGWNSVDFQVAPASLQQIILQGLAADTQFQFAGGARPNRVGQDFTSYLPADGAVKLSWQEARPEAEGKLFYAAESFSQITIGPGLMRHSALLDFKVMQGEVSQVALILRGAGEVTRVQGDQVLAWNAEPATNSSDRRLVIRLNQPQKDHFTLAVQMQTPLGAFPQTTDALQFRPEGATRFAGWIRIVNEGAVRLEIAQASGLSQISPDQFPESDVTKTFFPEAGAQRFAYRFSSPDFALRIQADQILPELGVSEVLAYNLGESEQSIDDEIELDVREAPLRELLLHVPKGYAIARLTAAGLADYLVSEPTGQTDADLRLVFGQPLTGRELIELRLERNQPLGETLWTLPRIEVAGAKSVRGHVAVSADAGFRLTPERTRALTEIATAFFPGKVAGIQSAFRLSDPDWAASVRVERLPQTVQADVFHLFSIGEGIAYGSSVMNYSVSGAPVASFRIELSDEYFNVEFTGRDIRNWEKNSGGYVVHLHTPVSGAYTLLATYERPFKPQGDTLAFTGARPLDAQSEQGHTLVISAYQFQVKPIDVSPNLLPLEPGEVPPEYRLFFDAPILAAYHYTARPFNLRLALMPLAQGDSVSQVVDRATLNTRISREGQVLTDVRYYVKSRGNPNFRVTLPSRTQLWSALVNGAAVVPVSDSGADLIPLPQRADPNALLTIDLKLAAPSRDARTVTVAAPIVAAPVMLAEWKLNPDAGRRLVFRHGSLAPLGGVPDLSGFGTLTRLFNGNQSLRLLQLFLTAIALAACAVIFWRWAILPGVYKFSPRHLVGSLLGLAAFVFAISVLVSAANLVAAADVAPATDITLVAPVQQPGSDLSVELANLPLAVSDLNILDSAWPVLLALVFWIFAWLSPQRFARFIADLLAWTSLAWAALRLPNGATIVFYVLAAFLLLKVAIPALRSLWQIPPPSDASASSPSGAPAVTTLLLAALFSFGFGHNSASAKQLTPANLEVPCAESVLQQIRVDQNFAFATVKIHWPALKGQTLPLLYEPGVLTHIQLPKRGLKLTDSNSGSSRIQQLFATENGTFDVEAQYELRVSTRDGSPGFSLPTPSGLINRINLSLANLDVDVVSPQAVSIYRHTSGSNTVAVIVLSPSPKPWIGWRPRTRDVAREKPVFYADLSQLYVPGAGVIEGIHYANIRPAQGELGELIFTVPKGATITDVADPDNANPSFVSLWRFDPDMRKLRVTLNPPQSRPFALVVHSEIATGPLPFAQSVGLLAVDNAAGQIGLLGIATGNEVQIDGVTAEGFSPINLEDFPGNLAQNLPEQFPGFAVHRAFRYASPNAVASVNASAVEPDIRVETQTTLSLGEDRTVLAANATVDITRAGIFRLSFPLPPGMDVESVNGEALSHWTESRADSGRVITLNLRGKTDGRQQFAVTLSGPGIKATNSWVVPQFNIREANKQRGTLLIVPEQGMRLQAAVRDGLTQLDPQKSGITQKGVLAFNILQTPWTLALDIEQVEPWIQVTSLQHATVSEAQVKILANLQYQIENTGLKTFHVRLPANAENVHFSGDQIADFLPVQTIVTKTRTDGMQTWEIKLQRRVIGQYFLQATYQVPLPVQATETVLRGIQAADVNLQRGFVTIQSSGRLQVNAGPMPSTLQPAEWQSIPRALQQNLANATANFAYRLVDPAFQLPLKLERREAVKLLPARVDSVAFTSVVSDAGVMLTHAQLDLLPGDKRLLYLTLPKDARFWFAFVNQNGVWPWRDGDRILIPLEKSARDGQPVPVEIFYSSKIGAADGHSLDLSLLAPQFDLPLENITWRVFLDEKWRLKNSSGSFQLAGQQVIPFQLGADDQTYLQTESSAQTAKTKQAELMLDLGNDFLQNGDPQEARRAFQSAYGLSVGDDAFNEDSRVQLNNLKLQQTLVGLNLRQAGISAAAGDGSLAGKLNSLRGRAEVAYTQQDARDIMDRNSAEENAADLRLAQRLVQQQDAAVTSPVAIRATIPEQGRELTFTRSVVVDSWADLRINLRAVSSRGSRTARLISITVIFFLCAVFAWTARAFYKPQPR